MNRGIDQSRKNIVPPRLAFCNLPRSIEDIISQTVNRVLALVDIDLPVDLFVR